MLYNRFFYLVVAACGKTNFLQPVFYGLLNIYLQSEIKLKIFLPSIHATVATLRRHVSNKMTG